MLLVSVAAVLLPLAGCGVGPLPGRFTYIVRYEVTAEPFDPLDSPTAVTVEYRNETGSPESPAPFAPPWFVEFSMDYDYDNPFYPELTFIGATFSNPGDKLTVAILWKDYKVGFAEEELRSSTVEYTGVPVGGVTLVGGPLPR